MTTQTYADLALDEQTGDIELPARLITADALVIQRLRLRLRAHRGDWVLDNEFGLPYEAWVGQVPAPLTAITLAFTEILGTCPGVARISNARTTFDVAARTARYAADLLLGEADDGRTPTRPLGIVAFVTGAGASRIIVDHFRPGAVIP